MAWRAAGVAIAVGLGLTTMIRPASAQDFCREIRPAGNAGQNDILGLFIEGGVRCLPVSPWHLTAGARYTERTQQALPYAILSYRLRLQTGWDLLILASYRERLGSYEGHRLPEVSLHRSWDVSFWTPSVELSAGAISVIQTSVRRERFGVLAGLRSPTVLLSPTVAVTGLVRGGLYTYSSGESHRFWVGILTITWRLRQAEVTFEYTRQDGTGSSPLLYDVTGYDQYFSSRIGVPISATLRGTASAVFSLPAFTAREYGLALNHVSGWGVSATLRVADSRLLFGLTLPQ